MSDIETGSFASELNEAASTLRVVSWNIARGSRLDAIIEFLATANADIILLQESDKHARRTNYKNVASEIAEKLKIHYACQSIEPPGGGGPRSMTFPPYLG